MYNLGLTWCIKVHTVCVEDVSEEQTTAEHLKHHIKSVMAQLQTEWDVVLVAIMTDASKFIFKAKGGAPKKRCGRHRPALYSAAKSVGGGVVLRRLEAEVNVN